ncbi:hypothetical protein JIN85_11960 [Luteolibacter pohnpeiensis]|uniref:D-ribose pyranase n=1 Tax=Luteolibacter pohnpeiensis TaxID=454153 RepID=A0A934S5T8_9BACT|nr:RbsD/FucU domain-containing protein [Luteolibacter pohnpeiensis]MBK1883136.1 hypothetical protein [Luteolibacter pohnpeiensis]
MIVCQWLLTFLLAFLSLGCGNYFHSNEAWKSAIVNQTSKLGYRNWIVISEASFPAQSRQGVRQMTASAEIPEVVDYVMNTLEQTQAVSPKVYLTRELRSVENDFAPGIDEYRQKIEGSLHGHEVTELEQQSLMTLLEDASRSYNVLVIRTPTALPYTTVFLELQPGYWDADSEQRLRDQIQRERMQKISLPIP